MRKTFGLGLGGGKKPLLGGPWDLATTSIWAYNLLIVPLNGLKAVTQVQVGLYSQLKVVTKSHDP